MARPPTPIDQQRTAFIGVRATETQKAEIEAAAKTAGRTVSDWMLWMALAAIRKGKKG